MLTGDNGILKNASNASSQSAYRGAEEQVKLAYMAVKTEIMAQTTKNGAYDARTLANTKNLKEIVEKDLNDSKWKVRYQGIANDKANATSEAAKKGIIYIEYKDPKIDKGSIDSSKPIPAEEGYVHSKIIIDVQDATLEFDTDEDETTFQEFEDGGLAKKITNTLQPGQESTSTTTDNYEDKSGKTATVPKGYTVSTVDGTVAGTTDETSIDTGLVIKKGSDEYVWIEVPRSIFAEGSSYLSGNSGNAVTSSTDYQGIYNVLNSYAGTYREGKAGQGCYWTDEWYDKNNKKAGDSGADTSNTGGCGLSSTDYTNLYHRMLTSVFENGGFWIGRYEAGSTTNRSSHSSIASTDVPLSQSGKYPYAYVYCSEAQNLASRVATTDTNNTGSDAYVSSLMFGIQWDLVCKFLEGSAEWDTSVQTAVQYINTDSSSWGRYYGMGGRANTGSTATYRRKNIYDIAGNVYEWTLEHATSDASGPCASRGGVHKGSGSYYPASYRDNYGAEYTFSYHRFPCCTLLVALSPDSDGNGDGSVFHLSLS